MISSQLVFDARENSETETLKYYHDGSNVIAEYDASDNLSRRYIHGTTYVDERAMLLEGDPDGASFDTYYYLLEDLHTVTGMMHKNGSFAEGYTYDAYGRPRIMWYHPGDINRDGDIDVSDLARISAASSGSGNATDDPRTDMDRDGDTDITDYAWVLLWMDLVNQPEPLWVSAVGNPYFFTGRRMNWVEADFAGDPAENKPLQYNRARHYCSVHGRWLQRDPKKYVDGMNLYEYVSSNPLFWLDPFGWFEIEWEGNWTQGQKNAVTAAMSAVKRRVGKLLREIDASIKKLEKCPDCYGKLIKKTKRVRKLFQRMKNDIDSKSTNLEIYQSVLDGGVLATARNPIIGDFELTLSVRRGENFFAATTADRLFAMFHELSHFRGTKDRTPDWSNNAHRLDDLAQGTNWEKFGPYRLDKINADKRKKAGKCCCPKKAG